MGYPGHHLHFFRSIQSAGVPVPRGYRPWRSPRISLEHFAGGIIRTRILGKRTAPFPHFHISLFLTPPRMVLPQDPSTKGCCLRTGGDPDVGDRRERWRVRDLRERRRGRDGSPLPGWTLSGDLTPTLRVNPRVQNNRGGRS